MKKKRAGRAALPAAADGDTDAHDDDDSPKPATTAEAEPRAGGLFPIVGIGASAGGLEAFTHLLKALPADTGMAFVFVQHLAPTHVSALAEILSRATPMPVMEVQDEPTVERDHIYVIPPGQDMVISGGRLHLQPRQGRGAHRPVDQFFRALAEDQRHQAIGVILSGTGTDGTIGLDAIKAEGGITFAQDATAQHEGMPHSAIASGCVDFVLPPDAIAHEIIRIGQHPYAVPEGGARPPVDTRNLAPVLLVLQRATGVDFTHYKFNTLYRRVTRRMVLRKMDDLQDYVRILQQDPAEVDALYHDILISVTSFFRNPEAFDVLKEKVFPRLVKDRSRHDPVRIWSLGCSTGQEAYSLAMIFAEFAEGSTVPFQIFATDLVARGVDTARAGVYSKDIAQDVSPERLRRFFVEVDAGYQITKAIRDVCVFSRHNVLADPPFSRIDLISCRNLLIYLEPVLQQQIMPILHYALKPSGFLWLGGAETIGGYRNLFEAENAKHKIYLKKPGPHGAHFSLQHGGAPRTSFIPIAARPAGAGTDLHREADRLLLSKFAPPSVLVTANLDILQYRGDTGPYLAPAPGKASLNLLKMLREGLLVGVRGAIVRAGREQGPTREEGLRVTSNGVDRSVAVEVVPLEGGGGTAEGGGGFLVVFDEATGAHGSHAARLATVPRVPEASASDHDGARLAQELSATREYLQSVIEQQEAANEELQSANEEVQSANEELQSINEELETTKEEIQSSNEELTTVNDELNNRNADMNRLNNDLVNLIGSVQVAIVIVGPDLRIRRFTPAAEKLLNLIPTDVGRPLVDIKLHLDNLADLEPLLTEVIDTVTVRERDVRDNRGCWYSLRLRPYRTLDHKIDGVVVMLVDVDAIKRAHEASARLAAIVATSEDAIISKDLDGIITSWNTGAERLFGYSSEEAIGKPVTMLIPPEHVDEEPQILERVRRGEVIEHYETVRRRKDGGLLDISLAVSPLTDAAGRVIGASKIARDITERKRAEGALLEHQQRLEFTLESANAGDWDLDLLTGQAQCSFRHDQCFGATEPIPDWSYDTFLACVHPDDRAAEDRKFRVAVASGQDWNLSCRVVWPDGSVHWIESSGRNYRYVDGRPTRMLGMVRDVTERTLAAEALRERDMRFRALIGASSDVVYHMSPDWTEMRELHGRDFMADTEAPSRTWLEKYIPPDDQAQVMAVINQAVRARGVFQLEHRVLRVDGTLGWTSSRAVPLLDAGGDIIEWVGMASDVTERRAAEAVLRQSEERLRTLADNMSQFAWTADAKGWIYWYNQRWYDYTGTTLEEMQGWGWTKVHHPDHVDRVVTRIQRSWDTGELWEDTFPLRGKDGTYRWFLSRSLPIRDEEGKVLRWFGTNTDVTEQRQLADELRQNAADMSETDRRKNEFLAMLAHELRSPLAPIRNALHIVRHAANRERHSPENDAIRSATDMMERQTGQLVRMVDDLLDVSRVSLGKIELRRVPVELASIVTHAVEASTPLFDGGGLNLTVTVPPEPIYLSGDSARMIQVIGNLLNNAAKFTPKGGDVWLTVERDDGHAVIRVRDTGIGMGPDDLSRVFELFVQVDTSLERTRSGLGLGLTLAKDLVQLHDGTIDVHSGGPGQGTEFVVHLPVLVESPTFPPSPQPRDREDVATIPRRILVVDDNRDSAESLAILLELRGHAVQVAYDGIEAVDVATTFTPEVVLLDIGLPKLNGYEAARHMRNLPSGGQMLLVALTGWAQDHDRSRSAEAGFDVHLVKPVDHDALSKLMADLPPSMEAPRR